MEPVTTKTLLPKTPKPHKSHSEIKFEMQNDKFFFQFKMKIVSFSTVVICFTLIEFGLS